jgi:hypothetical protein
VPDPAELLRDLRAFAEACGFPMAEWQAEALKLDKRTTILVSPRPMREIDEPRRARSPSSLRPPRAK